MKNRNIFLLFSVLAFTLAFQTVSACSLTDLTSCSIPELKQIIMELLSISSSPAQTSSDSSCPSVYLPVCGFAGSYDNLCKLNEAGDELSYYGECLESPYSLSPNDCLKYGFYWNGFKCVKNMEETNVFVLENLGIQFSYPQNSILKEDFIDLPKEQNNTNLIAKRLKVSHQSSCENIALYTNVTKEENVTLGENVFKVIEGTDELDYGEGVSASIKYRDYILEQDDGCISFLFSLMSFNNNEFANYNYLLEKKTFDQVMTSLTEVEKVSKTSPCNGLGDLNEDQILNQDDILLMNFGTIELDFFKKADLNNDDIIDDQDVTIFNNYLSGIITTFPACTIQTGAKKGTLPLISNTNIRIDHNSDKTLAEVRFDFRVEAKNGDVYIPTEMFNFSLANASEVVVEDVTWNTSAAIEDNYIFIEEGGSEWIYFIIKVRAKEKPIYSKLIFEKIGYLDDTGTVKYVSAMNQSEKIYLNYIEKNNNLICGEYGDVNGDNTITQEDFLYIIDGRELTSSQIRKADVTGNGEVNLNDALAIKNYLDNGVLFSVCNEIFAPKIYDDGIFSVEDNGDKTKHVYITFYLEPEYSDVNIPAEVTFNRDNETAGVYLTTEKDGKVVINNIKLYSNAEPENGMLKFKKGLPQWIRIEFDINAIKDTALVKFIVDKVVYLDNGERKEIFPENLETADIFLNLIEEKLISPCDNLGDLNYDGFITQDDYNFLNNNMDLVFSYPERFLRGDINRDGRITKEDLKELEEIILSERDSFSGCLKILCSDVISPVYTIDGEIYGNKCFTGKEIKFYIDQE